jgi:DNA-binding LacI/PurR family transcriptional regulator
MPKKVFDSALRLVQRDITSGYKVGDAYLTLHQIAEKFDIGYGTAVKIVAKLAELNMVETIPGSGTTIKSLEPRRQLEGMTIALMTRIPLHDPFVESFHAGAQECAAKEGISVVKVKVEHQDYNSISFGDAICAIEADGIVAINFDNSPLAFYRSMVKCVDLVADIPYEELPMLPVVATDNFRHGQEAARRFHENGFTESCVVTWSPADKQTCRGFMLNRLEGFMSVAKEVGMDVVFVQLNTPDAEEKINRFFFRFNDKKAAFSLELRANWFVVSQFAQRRIPIRRGNLLVYDNTEKFFTYEGLQPIPTVGPSWKQLGQGLTQKLIAKWKTGSFSEPACTFI